MGRSSDGPKTPLDKPWGCTGASRAIVLVAQEGHSHSHPLLSPNFWEFTMTSTRQSHQLVARGGDRHSATPSQ